MAPGVRDRSVGQKALADATATALFVYAFAAVDTPARWLAPHLGLAPTGATVALVVLLLIALGPLCNALGGALCNPANNAFVFARGEGTATEHLVRSVAQACGGVVGARLAQALLPASWTGHLPGLAQGLRAGPGAVLEGMACEFVLGLLLTWVVLYAGTLKSSVLRLWVPLLATVLAVKAGEGVTGPSLNPAFTFSWLFLFPHSQSAAEHCLVYWVAPLAAGLFGGWAFEGWQQWDAQRQRRHAHAKAD